MVSIGFINSFSTFLCLTGLGLSIYAYTIELQVEHNSKYEAMCDISEHISCTKAFKSEEVILMEIIILFIFFYRWAKGLGIFSPGSIFYKPNSLLGILYYSLVATLAQTNSLLITKLSYWMVFLANLSSLYFAYILYFKLYDFCIVCVSTYIVNIFTLIFINWKLRKIASQSYQTVNKKDD